MPKELEESLKQKTKKYLEENNWEVKEEVVRADCINWKYPYKADLLIRHPFYHSLGWIGLELKIFEGSKKIGYAFEQIISKYQGNYFEKISAPVWVWGIVVNTIPKDKYELNGKIGIDPYYTYTLKGIRLVLTRFGVGLFIFDKLNPWPGRWYNSRYNRLDFVESNQRFSIYFEEDAMKNYANIETIKKFIAQRTSWRKHVNINNLGKGWWQND